MMSGSVSGEEASDPGSSTGRRKPFSGNLKSILDECYI